MRTSIRLLFALTFVLGLFAKPLWAPPTNAWFDQLRLPTRFDLSPTEPPPSYPPLNVSGTFRNFSSGDDVLEELVVGTRALVACRGVFQPDSPLFDNSTGPVDVIVNFLREGEDDQVISALTVCHAIERAAESGFAARIMARIPMWAERREADLYGIVLQRMGDADLAALPAGLLACDGDRCGAEGIAVRYEAKVHPVQGTSDADLCTATLAAADARFSVMVNFWAGRKFQFKAKTDFERGKLFFYVGQQCRSLAASLFSQKPAEIDGLAGGRCHRFPPSHPSRIIPVASRIAGALKFQIPETLEIPRNRS